MMTVISRRVAITLMTLGLILAIIPSGNCLSESGVEQSSQEVVRDHIYELDGVEYVDTT